LHYRYDETRSNLALFAVDYQALFVDTIGRVVQQVRLQQSGGCLRDAAFHSPPSCGCGYRVQIGADEVQLSVVLPALELIVHDVRLRLQETSSV
jgi:hypothetical protein